MRRGTSVVEAAVCLPVFFFFFLALVEFGHARMVQTVLQSACRNGVRLGSTEGVTTSQVEVEVRGMIAGAFDPQQAELFVKDASTYDGGGSVPESGEDLEALPDIELNNADERQLFLIRARVAYNDIALVPMPFMNGVVLSAEAFMRHE
jgi:hypothetical protein